MVIITTAVVVVQETKITIMQVLQTCQEMDLVDFLQEECLNLSLLVVDAVPIPLLRHCLEAMD
jgi:hypothetical protein